MFRGTNFTESNESYRAIEGEMEIALRLWQHFYDRGCRTREQREREAFNFACEIFESKIGPMPPRVSDLSADHQGVWMMDAIASDWYSEWAEHAFPRVQMSHSFASMLMATRISPKEIEHVEAPWPAFSIEIPDKLLPIQAKGVDSHITRVEVNTHFMPTLGSDRWWTFWMQGQRIELSRAGTLEDLCFGKAGDARELAHIHPLDGRVDARDAPIEEDYDAFWANYSDEQEDRIHTLVTRLVLGVCVLMTERANYQERTIDLRKKLGPYAERTGKAPESRLYTLGKPVQIDFRQAVRAFVEGRSRGPLTVQRLVAGHHKRQPHGPGGSLRKWIFIEPYWQGPVDAPILVRSHDVGK